MMEVDSVPNLKRLLASGPKSAEVPRHGLTTLKIAGNSYCLLNVPEAGCYERLGDEVRRLRVCRQCCSELLGADGLPPLRSLCRFDQGPVA